MIRLEVQKSDNQQIRIALESSILKYRAVRQYHTVQISDLSSLLREITQSIPKQFLVQGANENLLARLKNRSQSLFRKLMGELGTHLTVRPNEHRYSELNVILDEELASLPIENLYNGTHFLWEIFIISRQIAASGPVTETAINPPVNDELAIVGNPMEDSNLEQSIRDECFAIAEDVQPATSVTGPVFGREVDRYYLTELLADHTLFHFSGHFVNSGKDDSGWQLYQSEVFRARDIRQLSRVPRFIFSNSCGEPASADQGGFIRSFLDSGVQTYLATVMDIPTMQAADFAIAFYHKLAKNGRPGEALNHARKKHIHKYGWHDLTWMAYTLYGNAEFLELPVSVGKRILKMVSFLFAFGVLTAAMFGLRNWSLNEYAVRRIAISSVPSGAPVFVDNHLAGQTPLIMPLKNSQQLEVRNTGYASRIYQFAKDTSGVRLISADQISGIVTDTVMMKIQPVQSDSLIVNLIPDMLHIIKFSNLGYPEGRVMIQGSELQFAGDTVVLAVDDKPHRFIVRTGTGVYDSQLTVTADTTYNFVSPGQEWLKDRFR